MYVILNNALGASPASKVIENFEPFAKKISEKGIL